MIFVQGGHPYARISIVHVATSPRRRVAVLLAGLSLAATGLSAIAPVPAHAVAPADGAGYVDFSYGTVTDDVTAHTSQSKLWHHDGTWWAVMMEPRESAPFAHEARWAIFRFDVASQSWVSTKVQVDERNQSHPDVLASGDNLFVVSSHARSASEPVKVFKFDYLTSSNIYVLDPLFVDADPEANGGFDDGVETRALGVKYATIARSGNTLLIAYTASGKVWYMTAPSDNALEWTTPTPLMSPRSRPSPENQGTPRRATISPSQSPSAES